MNAFPPRPSPFFAWNRRAAMLLAPRETREAWVRKAAAIDLGDVVTVTLTVDV